MSADRINKEKEGAGIDPRPKNRLFVEILVYNSQNFVVSFTENLEAHCAKGAGIAAGFDADDGFNHLTVDKTRCNTAGTGDIVYIITGHEQAGHRYYDTSFSTNGNYKVAVSRICQAYILVIFAIFYEGVITSNLLSIAEYYRFAVRAGNYQATVIRNNEAIGFY